MPVCRYDPYGRVLTREEFDQAGMRAVRRKAIQRARMCKRWGLVLGTLGRQGNPALLRKLQAMLDQAGLEHSLVLLSEVTPDKLAAMPDVEAWVQVACPRCVIACFSMVSTLLWCVSSCAWHENALRSVRHKPNYQFETQRSLLRTRQRRTSADGVCRVQAVDRLG